MKNNIASKSFILIFCLILALIDIYFTYKGGYNFGGESIALGIIGVVLINGIIFSIYWIIDPMFKKSSEAPVAFVLTILAIIAGIVDLFTSYHGIQLFVSEQMNLKDGADFLNKDDGQKMFLAFLALFPSFGTLFLSYFLFKNNKDEASE